MIDLDPAPSTLGLHSPAIGPWFDDNAVELGAPADGELAVAVTLGDGGTQAWLPPAAGTLSFCISSSTRPKPLAGLRSPQGEAAFENDRLIALFRLLPEVEERIEQLMGIIPTLAGGVATGAGPRRPRVRSFALEFTQASPNLTFVEDRLYNNFGFPPGVTSDDNKAAHLGLGTPAGPLTNASKPMVDLIAPGMFATALAELMRFTTSTDARMWVFDHRGHPVDPGAVGTWWRYLVTHDDDGFTNLWAEGIEAANQRTAALAAGATDRFTIHLVNAHGGPLTEDELNRLATTNVDGTGAVRRRGTDNTAAAQLSFTAAPTDDTPDDFPEPNMAVLPDGRMGATVNLWPAGAIDPGVGGNPSILTRDFARVAVTSIEHHLVGQKRSHEASEPATDEDPFLTRRAADQNRASTGLRVARCNRGAVRDTTDPAITAAMDVFGGGGNTSLVTEVLHRDWGARVAGLPAGDPPGLGSAPEATVVALTGGGTNDSGTVVDQRVLVTLTFDPAPPENSWVRGWTQGFDHDKAEHIRLDGGAGRMGTGGVARLVAQLPDGAVDPDALMGMEVMVVTAGGARLYSDVRFDRPTPVGGSMADLGALSAGTTILVCDTAAELTTPVSDAIPSGAQLVADPSGTPTYVDRSTVPDGAWAMNTVVRTLASGDVVQLTEPAFKAQPEGDAAAAFSGTSATVNRVERDITSAWQPGFPLPGMHRLEIVAANVDAAGAIGAVASASALGEHHEILPHRQGHPECPAAGETHGTGVRIQGPAAIGLAEYVRDRTANNTIDLITASDTPLTVPTAPTADSLWAVGLRTEAAGVAAEVGLSVLLDTTLGSHNPYPFGDTWTNLRNWLNSTLGATISGALGAIEPAAQSIIRAVDRRFLANAYGAREGSTSMIAAIHRAEDFIYIETPALDNLAFGQTHDQLNLWQALLDRMTARPNLQVVVCLPVLLPTGNPRHLQQVRDAVSTTALGTISGHSDRFAAFHPSAGPQRALRMSSTTMIVDDAYACTGTTHLWRRGLSFDSSFAVALFDDRMQGGRPQEIRTFRRALVSGRLGLGDDEIPDDPEQLVQAIRTLVDRGGHGRIAPKRIRAPKPSEELQSLVGSSSFTTIDIWNRDGSPPTGFNPVEWLLQLTTTVQSGEFN